MVDTFIFEADVIMTIQYTFFHMTITECKKGIPEQDRSQYKVYATFNLFFILVSVFPYKIWIDYKTF